MISAKQVAYITDLLNGLTVTEIAEKHGIREPTVSAALHRALGAEYAYVDVHDIKMSVFKGILENACPDKEAVE